MEKLFLTLHNLGVWVLLAIFLASCLSVRKWQTTQTIQFHFRPNSALWNDLLQNTQLTSLIYVPNILCFTGELQAFFFLLLNPFKKEKYRREILTLSDGGTIAIDWTIHKTPGLRDIVICIPGLSGDC